MFWHHVHGPFVSRPLCSNLALSSADGLVGPLVDMLPDAPVSFMCS